MWKKYFVSLIFVLGLVTSQSCSQSDDLQNILPDSQENELTLTINFNKINTTASRGDISYESAIKTLDFFLFNEATEEAKCQYQVTIKNVNGNTVKFHLPDEVVKKLFNENKTTCTVYAIANYSTDKYPEAPTVNELKRIVIGPHDFSDITTSLFVMDNSGNEVITKEGNAFKGTINLSRSAIKASLTITKITNGVKDKEGNVWNADSKQMHVTLINGVRKSHIDNDKRLPYQINSQEDYFSSDSKLISEIENDKGTYTHTSPFYSYPSEYLGGNKFRGTYLLLEVPWIKQETNGSKISTKCYYHIPLSSTNNILKRNHYYQIRLSVSALGSFDPQKPTKLTPSYQIVPWGENTVDADLNDYRYLVVDYNNLTVKNQDKVDIKYSSSHPIEFTDILFTHKSLEKIEEEEKTIYQYPHDRLEHPLNPIKIDKEHHTLSYKRHLENTFTEQNFDFTPYKLTFTIQHTDNPNYKETVTIVQYPAIYGEADINSGYTGPGSYGPKNGSVFVNGYINDGEYPDDSDKSWPYDIFADLYGMSKYNDNNPNMYVFTITSVEGTDYIIGDPREKEISESIVEASRSYNKVSSEPASAWYPGPVLADNGNISYEKRKLKYYYATDTKDTKKMIAPKFRVASSYAMLDIKKTSSTYLDCLRKRCASYQEDGYPAGRWRLPTKAELEFLIYLVNKGKIPPLYVRGKGYWCAHGLTSLDENGNISFDEITEDGNIGHSVRCVYDEWYWNDKLNDEQKKSFTWGDRPR